MSDTVKLDIVNRTKAEIRTRSEVVEGVTVVTVEILAAAASAEAPNRR